MGREVSILSLDFAGDDANNVDRLEILNKLSLRIDAQYFDPQQIQQFRCKWKEARKELSTVLKSYNQINQFISIERGARAGNINIEMQLTSSPEQELGSKEEKIEYNLVSLVSEELRQLLITFNGQRIIIILDGCERLHKAEKKIGMWLLETLLPDIRRWLLQRKIPCYVIIAGRVKPSLEVIKDADQWWPPLKLRSFAKEQVDRYLQEEESIEATLLDDIYNMTGGHPHCIGTVMRACWEMRNGGGGEINKETLAEKFYRLASSLLIRDKVLRYLETIQRDFILYGPTAANGFNRPILRAVFAQHEQLQHAGGECEELFSSLYEEFIRLPIIVDHELSGRYEIYYVFHEIIDKYIQKEFPYDRERYSKLFRKYSRKGGKQGGIFRFFTRR